MAHIFIAQQFEKGTERRTYNRQHYQQPPPLLLSDQYIIHTDLLIWLVLRFLCKLSVYLMQEVLDDV